MAKIRFAISSSVPVLVSLCWGFELSAGLQTCDEASVECVECDLEFARLGRFFKPCGGELTSEQIELKGRIRCGYTDYTDVPWANSFAVAITLDLESESGLTVTGKAVVVLWPNERHPTGLPSFGGGDVTFRLNDTDPEIFLCSEWVTISVFPEVAMIFFDLEAPLCGEEYYGLTLLVRPRFNEGRAFFRRGDVTGEGRRSVSDAIAILDGIFRGGSLDCLDAADVDDDGAVDVSDAIRVLLYLFGNTQPLPGPSRLCGFDQTDDELDCQRFSFCE